MTLSKLYLANKKEKEKIDQCRGSIATLFEKDLQDDSDDECANKWVLRKHRSEVSLVLY